MKRHFWILAFVFPLALAGCGTMDEVASLLDDEAAQAEDADGASKYISVIVKDRHAFRIKDPLGRRTTGGHCGLWKDQVKNLQGTCCWNNRGECACPCPE